MLCLAAAAVAGDQPRLVWSYGSGVEGWVPQAVAVGNRGTQVFSRVGPVADHTRLLSAHDANPPSPVWTHSEQEWTFQHQVDSAEDADIHVSIHKEYVSGNSGPKRPVVQKFTSSSSAPDWTYPLSVTHNGSEMIEVSISADGQTIVAMAVDPSAGFDPRVLVFDDPDHPTPAINTLIPTTGSPSEMHLSGDGRTLHFWGSYALTVVEVATAQVIWTQNIYNDQVWRGHSLSYDGRMLVFGAGDSMRIYERSGQSYLETFRYNLPAGYRCEATAISRDGSTLVFGANASDNLTVRILALNLSNHQVTMLSQQTGIGTKANKVSALGVAGDGSYFAVGLWGDEFDTIPEVQFFDSRQNQPIGTYDLSGSALALDLSQDGRNAVVGAKAAHANDFAGGGSVNLFDARPVDFRVNGVPSPGAPIEFELYAPGPQPSGAVLLSASSLADTPETFPGSGTLYLPRNGLSWTSMGSIGPDGTASLSTSIPPGAPLGSTLYYQGMRTQGRQLSRDWVKLTVVP